MIHIALLSHSRHLDREQLAAIAAALQIQANEHFQPAWPALTVPLDKPEPVTVQVYDNAHHLPVNAYEIVFFEDEHGTQACGYHALSPRGRSYSRVFVEPCLDAGGGALHTDGPDKANTISVTASHELLEMLGDASCDRYVQGPPIPQGDRYAVEVCDPVEENAYDITLPAQPVVTVSDFILPAWFKRDDPGPYDYLKVLSKPFSLAPSGYMLVRGPDEKDHNIMRVHKVFGQLRPPPWRMETKAHPAARSLRRAERLPAASSRQLTS